jgi:hypothetical protein
LEKEDIDVSIAPKKNILRPPTDYSDRYYKKEESKSKEFSTAEKVGIAAIAIMIVLLIFAFIVCTAGVVRDIGSNSTTESNVIVNGTDTIIVNNTDTVNEQQEENSIYVSEIGRTCYLLEDGNYYDPDTDCYFWYNIDVYPNTWQYWYEGISSDYGDYGWMEYDVSEGLWYIQVSDYDWIVLPDEYDTSYLWYIQ